MLRRDHTSKERRLICLRVPVWLPTYRVLFNLSWQDPAFIKREHKEPQILCVV